MESEKLKALEKDSKYAKETRIERIKEEKAKVKQIRKVIQLCDVVKAILGNLLGKITVASSIESGKLFRPIKELYDLHKEEDPALVFASHHLGYEVSILSFAFYQLKKKRKRKEY